MDLETVVEDLNDVRNGGRATADRVSELEEKLRELGRQVVELGRQVDRLSHRVGCLEP